MRNFQVVVIGAMTLGMASCASDICSKLEGANFNTKAAPCTTGVVRVTETIPAQSACVTALGSCSAGDEALLTTYAGCLGALSTCSQGTGEGTFVSSLEACNDGISGLSSKCAAAFGLPQGTPSSGSSSSSGTTSSSSSSSSGSTGVAGDVCNQLSGSGFNAKVAACATGAVSITETIPTSTVCVTDLSSCNAGDEALLTTYSTCLGALSTCSPGVAEGTFVISLEACNGAVSGLTATCATAFGLPVGSTGGSSGSTSSTTGTSGSSSSPSRGSTSSGPS